MIRRILTLVLLLAMMSPASFAEAVQPQATGLVLTAELPADAVLEGTDVVDGGYTQRLTTADGMVAIRMLRRTGGLSLRELMAQELPDVTSFLEGDAALVGSYPAARADFTYGENEDARIGVIVALSTDTDSFAFIADAALDAYNGDDGYRGKIEAWVASLDVRDEKVLTGLRLTAALPEDAQEIAVDVQENGDYTQQYAVDSGKAIVVMARRLAAPTAAEMLGEMCPAAEKIKQAKQKTIGSYPAERLTFTDGKGKDARSGLLVALYTDSGSFAFVVRVKSDAYNKKYKKTVEAWITSLDFIDG